MGASIAICDDVYISVRLMLLPGIRIGSRCLIRAFRMLLAFSGTRAISSNESKARTSTGCKQRPRKMLSGIEKWLVRRDACLECNKHVKNAVLCKVFVRIGSNGSVVPIGLLFDC